MSPVIRMRDVVFAYRSRRPDAFSLSLSSWDVAEGERVALYGPSGSGKSTILGLISGQLVPDSGSVEVLGTELSALPEARRRAHRIRNMGFVFQDFPLVEYLDALENVTFPYRLNPALRLDRAVNRRARDLLEELGLGGMLRRRPAQLSQGERHRLGIARALITEPRLLLADEPTTGLDAERAAAVMDLIDRGITLVMVTHDRSLLPRFDRAVDMRSLLEGPT